MLWGVLVALSLALAVSGLIAASARARGAQPASQPGDWAQFRFDPTLRFGSPDRKDHLVGNDWRSHLLVSGSGEWGRLGWPERRKALLLRRLEGNQAR